ncbi:MAG: DUF5659 domain-containing protein [Eubacteriales bacterium]|nr:DUF5659 domain-containing protein [Eubacteriales bacterium]
MRTVYSMNLASYIIAATSLTPQLAIGDNDRLVFIFEDCEAINACFINYKKTKLYFDIKEYIRCHNMLKDMMRDYSKGVS